MDAILQLEHQHQPLKVLYIASHGGPKNCGVLQAAFTNAVIVKILFLKLFMCCTALMDASYQPNILFDDELQLHYLHVQRITWETLRI